MLSPKRTKFRKYHRGRMSGKIFMCFFDLKVLKLLIYFLFLLVVFFLELLIILTKFVSEILLLRYGYNLCMTGL